MKKLSILKYVCGLSCAISSLSYSAVAETKGGQVDMNLGYSLSRGNVVGGTQFDLQGGTFQVQDRFSRHFSILADAGGLHAGSTPEGKAGLSLITASVGPRYTWARPGYRTKLFGEALGGETWGFGGIFPSPSGVVSHSRSSALLVGGGVDVVLSERLAIRPFEADWLRTALPNATTNVQNNLRLSFGLTLKLN